MAHKNIPAFLLGLRDSLPIAAGYIPIAIAFGATAQNAGLLMSQAVAMSLTVFAGAAQFLAVSLFSGGTNGLEIVISALLLNARHLLFSTVIAAEAHKWPRPWHFLAPFGLTDEVFASASANTEPINPRRLSGMEVGAWTAWWGGTAFGYLAGQALPVALQSALGAALFCLFAALLASHIRKSLLSILPAIVAAGVHLAFIKSGWLPAGWAFTVAMIIGALARPAFDSLKLRFFHHLPDLAKEAEK
ncbi:MAG: hypothetical protein D6B26_06005 [Spirochaetaceae bacterium]|nr:MAG: hypothetical protein D6B26_06005 [Spirochaetaceae bacterium]